MSPRRTWVVDRADGLAALEARLNALAREGHQIRQVLALPDAEPRPAFIIVAVLGRHWLPILLALGIAAAFTCATLVARLLSDWFGGGR